MYMDVDIYVQQMTKSMSERRVKEKLESLAGVKHVHIHSHRKMIQVDYNPGVTTLEELCNKMEDLGCVIDR